MLSKLLSKSDCASCRICCEFCNEDKWETPVVTDELKEYILEKFPEATFENYGGNRIMGVRQEDNDLFACLMLDREKGCRLGDNKPFDCRIWPFRLMNFCGRLVITVSPVCPTMSGKPLSELQKLAYELAPTIYGEAEKHPEIVKDYIENYPILVTKKP